ncbi:hypothetical protein BC826DRAFT_1039916 [Russula brevipes]|nr:hypothetical protein BC826DRAFT_1039916 [Russula brevipes]
MYTPPRRLSQDDTPDVSPTQERVCPPGIDTPGSAFSASSLSTVDDNVSPLASSLYRGSRPHRRPPLIPDSPGRKGADPSPLVWVRVTRSGELALTGSGSGSSDGSYWWPACVTEGRLSAGPLTVSPYGEISPAAPRSLRLEAPSPSHVLPFKWPGQDSIRFSSVTFKCLGTSPQREALKRPKTALDEAWRSAVNLAHEADATLNDGLPSNLSSYRLENLRTHENKAKRSTNEAKASTRRPQKSSERWSPPPSDPLLEIPGELVYSLERKGRSEYWAARVEQYLPPKARSKSPMYRVRFKDDTCRAVSRDMFYTSDEREFYTCKLGCYASSDEESEVDSDDDFALCETDADEHAISIPPPNPEEFRELSIRDQFVYVKPVIKAILNEAYSPARERHRAFMQGGPSRDLTTHEVSRLGRVLQRWVLGPMHVQNVSLHPSPPGDLESETGLSIWTDIQVERMLLPNSPPPKNGTSLSPEPFLASIPTEIIPPESLRQIGSPSYEALSESDKLQYCLLVLFHEATLQLLLWRSGERRSPDLLSQEDEERLRLIGLAKSEERVWVEEISRMRSMMMRKSDPPSLPRRAAVSSRGRTLRPRNLPHIGWSPS